MREMDRLASALFPQGGPSVIDLKFFPGEEQVTVDDFCAEIHAAFVQVDSGLVARSKRVAEDHLVVIPVEQFLSRAA